MNKSCWFYLQNSVSSHRATADNLAEFTIISPDHVTNFLPGLLLLTMPPFTQFSASIHLKMELRASLLAQWLRICLPMHGTRVQALVREDSTGRGATKPVRHNYWACALEPVSHNSWAHVPQLLKPTCLEPVLRNKRSHSSEKPAHHNEE